MHLGDFFDYKNKLFEYLLTDEEIVSLINEDIPFEEAYKLVWDQLMPYEFYPDTIEQGRVYICCDVDIRKTYNQTFYEPVIYIYIFVHKSLLKLPEGGTRLDKLCQLIDQKLNGSMEFGLGELDLYSVKRFSPLADYAGKAITYTAEEFNRLYNPKKTIPNKRKG